MWTPIPPSKQARRVCRSSTRKVGDCTKYYAERHTEESNVAPTYKEVLDDTTKLMQSLKAITRLLLTSAAFRLLLSDIFASAREFLAQAAANVGNVALQVQAAAEDIERAANMNDGSLGVLAEKVGEAAGGILDTVEQPVNQSAAQESTKDVVIAKIQEVRLNSSIPRVKLTRSLIAHRSRTQRSCHAFCTPDPSLCSTKILWKAYSLCQYYLRCASLCLNRRTRPCYNSDAKGRNLSSLRRPADSS